MINARVLWSVFAGEATFWTWGTSRLSSDESLPQLKLRPRHKPVSLQAKSECLEHLLRYFMSFKQNKHCWRSEVIRYIPNFKRRWVSRSIICFACILRETTLWGETQQALQWTNSCSHVALETFHFEHWADVQYMHLSCVNSSIVCCAIEMQLCEEPLFCRLAIVVISRVSFVSEDFATLRPAVWLTRELRGQLLQM